MTALNYGPRTEIPVTSATRETLTEPAKGAGWILFAGLMIGLAAVLNLIWGLAAIANSGFFVAGAHYILLTNLSTWGWIALGWGVLELLAAFSIWRGGAFGRWFGIAAASLGVVLALMSLPASPLWSLSLAAISGLVVYGLAAYGGAQR
jgi:hypothetical protein